MRNLVENAVAHASGRIELQAYVGGGMVTLNVVDDGSGVPTGQEEAVFERFHRGDPARGGRGTGLGLSIARTIAQRHGGTLELVPSETGAHFRLVVPSPVGGVASAFRLSSAQVRHGGDMAHTRTAFIVVVAAAAATTCPHRQRRQSPGGYSCEPRSRAVPGPAARTRTTRSRPVW